MRLALAFLIAILALVLGACSSIPSSNTAGLPRLDVVPGQVLVLPLSGDDAHDARGRSTAWLDTGASIEVTTHQLIVSVVQDPTSERASRWLPAPGAWTSLEKDRSGDALTVLALKFPALNGEHVPKVIRIRGRDFRLQFLPTPVELATRATTIESPATPGDPWSPTLGSAGAVSPMLTALAWPEAMSPIGRWRFRMMSGTLNPVYESPPFEDRIVEALAIQNDNRWRAALAKLWSIDPDLTLRMKGRLAGVVDFGNGYVAPAWPTDHGAIDRLLADILDPSFSKQQISNRVEGWLTLQPRAIAWVIDDAGTISITGQGVGTVGVANLTELSTLGWISSSAAETSSLTPMPPFSSARMSVVAIHENEPGVGTNSGPEKALFRVSVHAGTWRSDAAVVASAVQVRAPGFKMGPLLSDYTMATWMTGGTPQSPAMQTAAMLFPAATASDGPELLVECKAANASSLSKAPTDPQSIDVVRVWIGPLGAPRAVFRVDATGAIADEARRPDLVKTPSDVRVVRTSDRWSFRLPIPAECIEPSGEIRLGITRTDLAGTRAAWPRPMLPWQDEPGRLSLVPLSQDLQPKH
jgi:hypothetical protein